MPARTTPSRARRGARRPIEAADLLRLVAVSDAQMSPDGASVLVQRRTVGARNAYETSLWIADAAGRRAARALTRGPKDAGGRFSPDGSTVAFVRTDAKRGVEIALVAARGGAVRTLLRLGRGVARDLSWSPCGTKLAYAWRPAEPADAPEAVKARAKAGLSTPPREIEDAWYRLDGDGYFLARRFALHVVEVRTRRSACVFDRDTLGMFSYDWAPDGSALVVAANDDPRALWKPAATAHFVVTLRGLQGIPMRLKGLPEGPKSNPRWSPDGMRIAYAGRAGTDDAYSTRNMELWCYDLRTQRAKSLTARADYCLQAATLTDSAEASFDPQIRWFPDGGAIFFRVGWHGSGRIASIPADGGAVALHDEPGSECAIGTFSDDGCRLAIVRSTPVQPVEAFVLEVQGGVFPATRVTRFNDALVAKLDLVEPQERWLTARDGHRVQCWVLRPRGARGRAPAVLEIHGGPHAQYGLTFFHEMQLLCAQGYSVWFSNPRGSKGYGRAHTEAIRGKWGTKDWTDIQAVLAAMRADAQTDRSRIGIMGGSYGGYMTNWAIAHDQGFAGAITDRCVSNLVSHAGNSDHPEVPDRYWPGAPWARPQALWRASPIAHFARVRTPTLVIHSEGDLRCNIEQGEQIYTALCTLGVPARFVRYPRESSHGMSRAGPPDLRLHRLGEIVRWWARHLGRRA